MMTYVTGDATAPTDRPVIIAHIVNDLGLWGAGFVVPLGKRYPLAKIAYQNWHLEHREHKMLQSASTWHLGYAQCVAVAKDVVVANMLAQRGLRSQSNPAPVKLDALIRCLQSVALTAKELKASVWMPKIGCGLGGRDWVTEVEPIVSRELAECRVVVCTLPQPT